MNHTYVNPIAMVISVEIMGFLFYHNARPPMVSMIRLKVD